MELEKQVCSLDLAKKLKELGVKQESLFYHWQFVNEDTGRNIYAGISEWKRERKINGAYWVNIASAFTVAELGEWLPENILDKGTIVYYKDGEQWYVETNPVSNVGLWEDTEANARAITLIYLIENKLVEVER